MRWLAGILLLILLGLQYRLWIGEGSLAELRAVRDEISVQKRELEQLRARNQILEAEVVDLRDGLDALEERARSELGMIKQGEMFLQIIGESGDGNPEEPAASADDQPPTEGQSGSIDQAGDEDGGLVRREVTADTARKP